MSRERCPGNPPSFREGSSQMHSLEEAELAKALKAAQAAGNA